MSNSRTVVVVGSLNIDLVTVTPRVPAGGETLAVTSFNTGFGGKGANQAVACARLSDRSPKIWMVGAVGDDQFGRDFIQHLGNENVATKNKIKVKHGQKTGTAVIIVEEESGENRIMFNAGANASLSPGEVHISEQEAKNGLVITQLETPLETVIHTLSEARAAGMETILNPAPASPLPHEAYENITHLIMNETEASILSGVPEKEVPNSLEKVSEMFLDYGVHVCIITLGSNGVYWRISGDKEHSSGRIVAAHKVKAIDTTAAGDTFVGAYAASLSYAKHPSAEGDVEAAVAYANRAASLAVQKPGAQTSIPYSHEMG